MILVNLLYLFILGCFFSVPLELTNWLFAGQFQVLNIVEKDINYRSIKMFTGLYINII